MGAVDQLEWCVREQVQRRLPPEPTGVQQSIQASWMVIDDATLTSSERESKLVHRTRHASDIHCILLDGGGG